MFSRLLAILLTITSVAMQQSRAADPDYSNVKDILQGRRTLLSVNDLVIGGTVLKTSDGTKIEDKNISVLPGFQRQALDQEILARLFDSISGTLVYARYDRVYAVDPVSHNTISLPLNDNLTHRFEDIASGDFRADGTQEVVLVSFSGVFVVSAVDAKDFSKGLLVGRRTPINPFPGARLAIAVGDFDGDGRPEIAVAFDTINYSERRLNIYKVDPQTLALQLKHSAVLPLQAPLMSVSMVAGRFGSTLRDELLLGYTSRSESPTLKSFDFDASLTPILKDTLTMAAANVQEMKLTTGRFDPISPFNQVALKVNQGRDNVKVGIVTLDNNLKIRVPNLVTLPGVACSSGGLAVGDYARTEPVPQDPSKTQLSLKFQLAISTSNCSGSLGVNVYNVDPPKTPGSDFVIDTNALLSRSLPQTADYGLPIVTGDIQGRSVVLGEPTKLVIADTAQPSVIAAMPPMHIDFVPPSKGEAPTLLNLSAVPSGFRTTYETNVTDAAQSSSSSTSSFSFGAEINTSASVEIGSVEDGLGLEVGASARAAQDIKQINTKEYGSYQSTSFDASTATGFADKLWYTDSRFNVYVYPIIGKTVCPSGKTGCAESEKVPLTIQFSGPDNIERRQIDGNLLPWYQPPWEPGNVFSYPANYKQLQQIIPGIQSLSDSQTYSTDSGTSAARASWTKETTDGASAGIDQNYSYEMGFSVSGAVGGAFVTGKASASLNLSGSSAFSNFNESVTSVGKSAGIGVEKPGTFRSPSNYHYFFTPYIFGQTKPGSVVDEQPAPGDVSTFGSLRTAFTANPDDFMAGTWWQQTYRDRPDVALNHPSRWLRVTREAGERLNCLESADGPNCFELAPKRPDNLWESNFHVMRGFFISNALSPGKGPQLTTAKAGDKLTLQARVYNYSFTPLPDGSEVHVRFYAQQIDKDHGHQLVGDGVLINEVTLSQIPPFSDADDAPLNWVLASTGFDTTGYDNKYLVFWVVVWIQDANGNLVPEIEGHGLRSVPGTLTSLADVQEAAYSNNVGFYNSVFYVFPNESILAAASVDGEPATIRIDEAGIPKSRICPKQQVDVTAKLFAENNSASGVTALFYDGDPHAGGVVFGLERIPYIGENDSYQVEAPYNAGACGEHELFVVVHEGTPDEVLQSVGKIKVDCAR